MKFLLDEHVDPEVGEKLENEGHEVQFIDNLSKGLPDRKIFNRAKKENRIIITRDDDFLTLGDQNDHPGIIFLTSYEKPEKLGKQISMLVRELKTVEMINNVLFIPLSE